VNADKQRVKRISFFGNFGLNNFGNESTLQAILYRMRKLLPDVEITCICTAPEAAATIHHISTFPISGTFVKPWATRNVLVKLIRKIFIGLPSELYRWYKALSILKGSDMLIIPGTGLLTDAYGLFHWGPYNIFKWVLVARLCHCKVVFVSVGAGPLYGTLGRYLVKSALSLASFRSYRDISTLQYIKELGFRLNGDLVYPDLAFSLPEAVMPSHALNGKRRRVVGLGLMEYAGKYSVENPSDSTYTSYMEGLVVFVRWLLASGYDIRLLIGDSCDGGVIEEFLALLGKRSVRWEEGRIVNEPVSSVEELLSQVDATDIVVATRFHNVLFALLLNKPVISIAFHHKCVSLMKEMGLANYCHDINHLDSEKLIDQFRQLESKAEVLGPIIKNKVKKYRSALDEQYEYLVSEILA
jgi:polysaccharide pyruvyl transferase WcaK-like protein